MTQEVQQEIAEVTQPEVTVTDAPAEQPEVAEQETEVAEQQEETLEQKVARLEKESHGKQRRIDKQAAKLQAEREQAAQLRAHLERMSGTQNPDRQLTPEMQRAFHERAVQVERETEAVVQIKGLIKQDANFADNLKAISEEAGPLLDDRQLPTPLLEQILECDNPAKVAKFLSRNPEEAAQLDGLSPTRLAKKLAVIESGLSQAPRVSKNPEPIQPIGQKGRGTAKSVDDMSMDEYIAHRKSQGARWAK